MNLVGLKEVRPIRNGNFSLIFGCKVMVHVEKLQVKENHNQSCNQ